MKAEEFESLPCDDALGKIVYEIAYHLIGQDGRGSVIDAVADAVERYGYSLGYNDHNCDVKDGKPSHIEMATDLVLTVLKNDEKAYRHWLDAARRVMEISHLPRVVQDGDWTPEQYELFTMEDALKIHYERNNPFERFSVNAATRRGDKGPGEGWLIYPGLASFALSLVDWRQVGGYFLLTAKDLKTY